MVKKKKNLKMQNFYLFIYIGKRRSKQIDNKNNNNNKTQKPLNPRTCLF